MDDYISRQSAIKTALTFFVEYLGGAFHEDMQAKLKRRFEEIPSSYVQPVVRCKYCKHSTEWYGDRRRCFLWCEDGISVFEDGFCNYWEMKDGKRSGWVYGQTNSGRIIG